VGSQGRRRLSGAGRGAPVSLTEDPTEATERQWQHCRQCRPDGWRRGAREPGQRLSGGPARRLPRHPPVRLLLRLRNACGKASGNHAGRLLGAPAAQVSRSAADETNACDRPAEGHRQALQSGEGPAAIARRAGATCRLTIFQTASNS
jgi:hypothetical protein